MGAQLCCQFFFFLFSEPEMPVAGLGVFPDCFLGQAGAELALAAQSLTNQ